MRVVEILVLIAAVVVLLTFFFRAWANLRRGKRFEAYNRSIRDSADLELQRLQNELDASLRQREKSGRVDRSVQTDAPAQPARPDVGIASDADGGRKDS
jgi:hypothetical protein